MMKHIFSVLLVIHVLCDFYFQTKNVAKSKQGEFKWVLLHSAVYAIVAILLIAVVMPGLPWQYTIAFVALHGVIDVVKYAICNCKYIQNKSALKDNRNIFIVDQIIHILGILAITYLVRNYPIDNLYNDYIRKIFDDFGVSEIYLLSWIIKILLICKPANILITNLLHRYKPDGKAFSDTSDKNAGRFIGTVERIIMTIFITIHQYSAVGLVLTAKSIARYDKISKDQEFAEYYLLGTLLSTICAICVSVLF